MWCIVVLLLLLVPSHSSQESDTGSEDIVSARCQSKCLLELEQRHKNQNQSEASSSSKRQQLKHHISSVCKEDGQCSSCILPCRESLFDQQVCFRSICHETVDVANCQESCAFLHKVNQRKPGSCPRKSLVSNLECTAMCEQDGDCAETHKCCTAGCSRKCVQPVLHDQRLLPIPDGITIQERKRKRSAIVRWIMKKMTPQHTSTNSNLFVIQWRWSIHKQEETMTPWQTIMVRNKMYAILKHLLSPGRYYTFRVAAVNVHGSYGFSKPSYPLFKLSKEVKAPSSPTNLTLETTYFDEAANSWTANIRWTPPYSDLPLKDYQLSWWKSTAALASAYQDRQVKSSLALQSKRSANDIITQPQHLDDEFIDSDYTDNHLSPRQDIFEQRRSIVLPSYSTQAELEGMDQGHVYMVELYATVESSEGELRGEPAVLFIWTNSSLPTSSSTPALRDVEDGEEPLVPDQPVYHIYSLPMDEPAAAGVSPTTSLPFLTTLSSLELTKFRAEIKPPYFDKGYLKSSISWLDHPLCSPASTQLFRVYISTLHCVNQLPPQQFQVAHCVANLDNLQFACNYFVEIEALGNNHLITRMTFGTPNCEDTPSEVLLQCGGSRLSTASPTPQEVAKKTTAPTTTVAATTSASGKIYLGVREKAKCLVTSSTSAKCGWRDMNSASSSPIIGYRATLTSNDHAFSNVSILRPDVRELDWTVLSQQLYIFRVQPISTHGLGPQLELKFNTKEGWRKHSTTPPPITFEHYGDSVELPLEASNASNVVFVVYKEVLRILALMMCTRLMN